ncbi:MAG: alpha/beta hydrolase [Betaproteobacteria bacterium]|nr:alpha/beta hydrolase [Betaproteobacteria bacterium]
MYPQHNALLIDGPAGKLETVIALPNGEVRGLALVAHPHPLYGGTMDNKVVQTLANTFVQLGHVAVRMNFRGVGNSEGTHDGGRGETEDWLAVHEYMRAYYPEAPLFLAGFSFGAFVQSEVARQLPCRKLVLVGPAVGTCPMGLVPARDTLVIHGERDETIPLSQVLDWARPQDLPIVVVPGSDHFFHRRLHLIREWVSMACGPQT